MTSIQDLSLEKFGSVGGDHFELLIAVALEELGYVYGETYLASWDKPILPGTWIEADFIVGPLGDPDKDPLKNPKAVFAIGHATSEDSARMKFHRDVEQLLEVKALPDGDEIKVIDVLFCCPRETMGGWSQELVAINEAIFDESLIVWRRDWGVRLLGHIQDLADDLPKGGTRGAKMQAMDALLAAHAGFRSEFDRLKDAIRQMLQRPGLKSHIQDMFDSERKLLPQRMQIPLLIQSAEKTEYKRGLIQVLALQDWELELLYNNHHSSRPQEEYSLEQQALDEGMTPDEFDRWWKRLQLLSVKIGTCYEAFPPEFALDTDIEEMRCFRASPELAYIFEHFDLGALQDVVGKMPSAAPNLVPYVLDLQDLSRAERMCSILAQSDPQDFVQLCIECYENDPWQEMEMPRLLIFEVAKAAVETTDGDYSYDVLANESGNPRLIQYPGFFRGIHPGKRGKPTTNEFMDGCQSLANRLGHLRNDSFVGSRDEILSRFVYNRFDGMVKQPKGSVLDALLEAEIEDFAADVGAEITYATVQGVPSAFNLFADTENAGVNVEIPYVLVLNSDQKIYVHRVMAEGGVGHKRKEFASKIRSIRYALDDTGSMQQRADFYSAVLVIDGKWVGQGDDAFAHVQMLTVAGWDYVVYPDGLDEAFKKMKKRLRQDGLV